MVKKYGIELTRGVDIKTASKTDLLLSSDSSILKVDILNQVPMEGAIKVTFNSTPPGVGGFVNGINTRIYSAYHGLGYIPAFFSYYTGPNFTFFGGGDRVELLGLAGAAPMLNGSESSEYTVFSIMTNFSLEFWINHDTSNFNTTIVGQSINLGYIIFASSLVA